MKNITVNYNTRTITVTKSFLKKATVFGSKEYNDLRDVKNDNPGFVVKSSERKSKKNSFKGLTYDVMRNYIQKHDEDGSILMEFEAKRSGESEDSLGKMNCNYLSIKKWFLETYPEVETIYNRAA